MIEVNLKLEGDEAWPDLSNKKILIAETMHITALEGGMVSGRPSVAIRIDLSDQEVVIAETSLVLFLTVADALRTRYGDPRV